MTRPWLWCKNRIGSSVLRFLLEGSAMKKTVLMAAMLGLAANAHAVCPKRIDGTWSGTQTNTETGFTILENGSILPTTQTGNGLVTLLFSGSTVRTPRWIMSESGPFGGVIDDSGTGQDIPFSYDKAKCTVLIDVGYDKLMFTLTSNGKVLNGIGFEKKDCNEDKSQCRYGLTKAFRLERQ